MALKVSENANRRDDIGGSFHGLVLLAIFLILIASVVITAYSVNIGLFGAPQNASNSSISVTQYGDNGIGGFNSLFGDFSAMTIVENFSSPDGTVTSFVISYSLVGITLLGSVRTYEINIAGVAFSGRQKDPESLLAWIDTTNGQVVQTYDNEDGYLQGSKAESENVTLLSFTTQPFLSMLNSSSVEQVQNEEKFVTIGQVSMGVTTYHEIGSLNALYNWTTTVGHIPSIGRDIVLTCSYTLSSGNKFAFRIISMEYSHWISISHKESRQVGRFS